MLEILARSYSLLTRHFQQRRCFEYTSVSWHTDLKQSLLIYYLLPSPDNVVQCQIKMPPRWHTHPHDVRTATVRLLFSKRVSTGSPGKAFLCHSTGTLEMSPLGIGSGSLATRGPKWVFTAQRPLPFHPCQAPPKAQIQKHLFNKNLYRRTMSRLALRSMRTL